MKSTKLFHALVLWGAAFGVTSAGCSEDPDRRSPDAAAMVDANRGDRNVDGSADAKPDTGTTGDAAADTADTRGAPDTGADSRSDAWADVHADAKSDGGSDGGSDGDVGGDSGGDTQLDIVPGDVAGWHPTK